MDQSTRRIQEIAQWAITCFYESEFQEALQDAKDGSRNFGGYLSVFDLSDIPESPLLLLRLGRATVESFSRRMIFSLEKAERLMIDPSHYTSFQTRDPKKGQWGGAVSLNCGLVVSFSGLKEEEDEAFSLALSQRMGCADSSEIDEIIAHGCCREIYDKIYEAASRPGHRNPGDARKTDSSNDEVWDGTGCS